MKWQKLNSVTITNGLHNISKGGGTKPFALWVLSEIDNQRRRGVQVTAYGYYETAEAAKAVSMEITKAALASAARKLATTPTLRGASDD